MPAIVAMLADDSLGQGREGAPMAAYMAAFAEIAANPRESLIVGEIDGRVVACCQLTVLSGLTPRRRAPRAGRGGAGGG